MPNISVVLKKSLDHLLCAVCHLNVELYDTLLECSDAKPLVAALQMKDPAQSATETSTKCSAFFKSSKLMTLATASQSPVVSVALIESGLLNVLIDALINKFRVLIEEESSNVCETNMRSVTTYELSSNQVAPALLFLSNCAAQSTVKDHIGKTTEFWHVGLLYLCSSSLFRIGITQRYMKGRRCLSTAEHVDVESAMLQLLSAFVLCHPENQAMITQILCNIMNGTHSLETGLSHHPSKELEVLPLTGFTRRLILQLLLQEEQITVCINGSTLSSPLVQIRKNFVHQEDWHPCFGAGYGFKLVKIKLSSTLNEISRLAFHAMLSIPCQETTDAVSDKKSQEEKLAAVDDISLVGGLDLLESLSLAAGINVKNKRSDKHAHATSFQNARMPDLEPLIQESPITYFHKALSSAHLPVKLTVAQIVAALIEKGFPPGMDYLELDFQKGCMQSQEPDNSVEQVVPLLSPLQSFASFGGLGIVSTCLPSNTPQASHSTINHPSYSSCLALPLSLSAAVLSTVPAHSLAAFGLFVRLPGYSEELLKDRFKAQYLLRLLLGAEDDGEGGKQITKLSFLDFGHI